MPFYLTPKQDDFNKIPELQIRPAEALYDVDSIVADPETCTKEELATLHRRLDSSSDAPILEQPRQRGVHCLPVVFLAAARIEAPLVP
jgi:hypothetical protein